MFAFAMGEANRGKNMRVFDWDRAAMLIVERKPETVGAGLGGDWECTGGRIYADGAPVQREDTYTFLASTWATPEIDIDGDVIDCWKWQHDTPGWDDGTYWPDSALAILAHK